MTAQQQRSLILIKVNNLIIYIYILIIILYKYNIYINIKGYLYLSVQTVTVFTTLVKWTVMYMQCLDYKQASACTVYKSIPWKNFALMAACFSPKAQHNNRAIQLLHIMTQVALFTDNCLRFWLMEISYKKDARQKILIFFCRSSTRVQKTV